MKTKPIGAGVRKRWHIYRFNPTTRKFRRLGGCIAPFQPHALKIAFDRFGVDKNLVVRINRYRFPDSMLEQCDN